MRRKSCACVSIERLTSTRMKTRGRSRRGWRQAGASGRPPVRRLARSVRRTSSRLPRAWSCQRRVRRRRRRCAMRSASCSSCDRSCGSHSDSERSCSASVRLAPPCARGAAGGVGLATGQRRARCRAVLRRTRRAVGHGFVQALHQLAQVAPWPRLAADAHAAGQPVRVPVALEQFGPAAPGAGVVAGDGAPGGIEARGALHRHRQRRLHHGLLLGDADLQPVLAQQRGEAGDALQRARCAMVSLSAAAFSATPRGTAFEQLAHAVRVELEAVLARLQQAAQRGGQRVRVFRQRLQPSRCSARTQSSVSATPGVLPRSSRRRRCTKATACSTSADSASGRVWRTMAISRASVG